jgi:hypothetical protein
MTVNKTVMHSNPSPITNLKTVKIHFGNRKDEEDGFYALMISGIPIRTLDKGRYLVNAKQRRILEDNGIKYKID